MLARFLDEKELEKKEKVGLKNEFKLEEPKNIGIGYQVDHSDRGQGS